MIPAHLTEGMSLPLKLIVLMSARTTAQKNRQLAEYDRERPDRLDATPEGVVANEKRSTQCPMT